MPACAGDDLWIAASLSLGRWLNCSGNARYLFPFRSAVAGLGQVVDKALRADLETAWERPEKPTDRTKPGVGEKITTDGG